MHNTRTVKEQAELLPFLFEAWPLAKKKQVREWLKHGAAIERHLVKARSIPHHSWLVEGDDVANSVMLKRKPERLSRSDLHDLRLPRSVESRLRQIGVLLEPDIRWTWRRSANWFFCR